MATLCGFCNEPEHSGGCDRETLKRAILATREELRLVRLELGATKKLPGRGVIFVQSLISHRDQKPRVDIQVGEIHTQMDAAAAIHFAMNVIQVATGANADAFVFHFITEQLKPAPQVAAAIIEEFRDYRQKLQDEFERYQEESGA